MSTREDIQRAEGAARPSRGALEDDFYRRLVQSGARVHIRCRDGYEVADGGSFGLFGGVNESASISTRSFGR